jgi:hypothetical protein
VPQADPRALALEALCKAVADPKPKVLFGSAKVPGIFTGSSQVVKRAAQLCLDQHWLEPTGESVGKGKSAKNLFHLTPAGIREALENTEPVILVRNLLPPLQESRHTLSTLRDQLAGLTSLVETLTQAVSRLSQKVAVPDVEHLLRQIVAEQPAAAKPQPPAPPAERRGASADWLDEVVRMVQEQKQRNPFQRLTLSQIYERLKSSRPELTLGRFHDGLRTLQEQRRIQLGPYTQALATLDDARNALYLDREVKYYADLP